MRRLELEMLDFENKTTKALSARWGAHVRL
jgi:hypothetical protein